MPATTPIYNETTDLGDIEPVVYDISLEDGQSDVDLQEVANEQVDVETKDIWDNSGDSAVPGEDILPNSESNGNVNQVS